MRLAGARLMWLVLVLLGLGLGVDLGTGAAYAQQAGRSVSWQRYDADLNLQSDGSLVVTETQTVSFVGTYRQGSRTIPLTRTTGITDVAVSQLSNGQSTPLQFSTQTTADGLEIDWSFTPVTNATQTFVLRYVAHGVARVYSAGDQVQWQAIYADRPGAVQGGTVTLHLPADAPSGSVNSATYLLPQNRAPVESRGGTVLDARTVQYSVSSLPAGTGQEIRAQFPHGLLATATPPPWQAQADQADWVQQTLAPVLGFLVLVLTAAALVGGGVGLFLLWYTRGRQPNPGAVPPMLDTPPSDLPAPLVGTLVDGVADLRDAVATLVDLAQRGVLEMTEDRGDVQVRLRTAAEDPSRRGYERVLLVALFERGATSGEILLSAARLRFAAAVPILEERLYQAVADEGLFVANPEATRRHYTRVGWLLVGIGGALAILAGVLLGWAVPTVWLPGAALVLVGLALTRLAQVMPRRTPRGALEAARWRAFRAHLVQQPHAQEHLAYAVALGVDREFLRRLELETGAPPPAWYMPSTPGGVIFVPGGWYGGPVGGHAGGGSMAPQGGGVSGLGLPSGGSGPQGWSDALADLLNSASGALSQGGGSGPWSGGGWSGGGGSGGGSGGWN